MNKYHLNLILVLLGILLQIFVISSCGFQVIYSGEDKSGSLASELAAIRIQKRREKLDHQMQTNLYDVLNPDFLKVEARYLLEVSLSPTTSATFITSTGATGRNRIYILATYKLKNLKDSSLISSGTTDANDNYDVSQNRYGNLVADDFIKGNLTKIIAQNIRNSIANDLSEIRRNCQNPPTKNFVCPLPHLSSRN